MSMSDSEWLKMIIDSRPGPKLVRLPDKFIIGKMKPMQEEGFVNLMTDLNNTNEKLVKMAQLGSFSDFGSGFDCPLMTLELKLKNIGRDDLAKKVREGHYDHDNVHYEKTLIV